MKIYPGDLLDSINKKEREQKEINEFLTRHIIKDLIGICAFLGLAYFLLILTVVVR